MTKKKKKKEEEKPRVLTHQPFKILEGYGILGRVLPDGTIELPPIPGREKDPKTGRSVCKPFKAPLPKSQDS
jgi:hypothetical protein